MMAGTTSKMPLNILLIGKTGHGKSSTGNSILGRRAFKTSPGPKCKTKEVTDAWKEDGQYEIKVVDGPGLEDTDLNAVQNKEQACENMAKALMMCNGGVHAFVLVIKFGCRFTEEEKRTISDLKQIFGESYLKNHGIIVITGGDHFADEMEEEDTPGKTFTEWCRENDEGFGNLFKECSFRVVMFNNRSKCEEEKGNQRNEFLDHVKQLKQTQGFYASEHFQMYAEVRKKLVKDSQQRILKETLQKRINLLSAELAQLSINSSERDIDELDGRIKDVYTEIEEEGKQQESMKPLIASLDRLRKASKEIRKSIMENDEKEILSQLAKMLHIQTEIEEARVIPWSTVLPATGVGFTIAGIVCSIVGVGSFVGLTLSGVGAIVGVVALGVALASFASKFLEK